MDGKNNEPRDVSLRLVWWVYKINQNELNNVINIKNPQLILSYTKPRKKKRNTKDKITTYNRLKLSKQLSHLSVNFIFEMPPPR